MIVRKVTLKLKANVAQEFKGMLEGKILPLLRKQKGFKDELTCLAPSGTDVFAITMWDQKENAELYNRDTYPQIVKDLEKFVEGTPQVQTFEVAHTTLGKVPAAV